MVYLSSHPTSESFGNGIAKQGECRYGESLVCWVRAGRECYMKLGFFSNYNNSAKIMRHHSWSYLWVRLQVGEISPFLFHSPSSCVVSVVDTGNRLENWFHAVSFLMHSFIKDSYFIVICILLLMLLYFVYCIKSVCCCEFCILTLNCIIVMLLWIMYSLLFNLYIPCHMRECQKCWTELNKYVEIIFVCFSS